MLPKREWPPPLLGEETKVARCGRLLANRYRIQRSISKEGARIPS
jgi:hypothetical protein